MFGRQKQPAPTAPLQTTIAAVATAVAVKPTRHDAPIPAAEDTGLDAALAARVTELFPAYTLPKSMVDYANAEVKLAQTLRQLGIRPFVTAEVEAYKKATTVEPTKSNEFKGKQWVLEPLGETWKQYTSFGSHERNFNEPVPQFALHTAVRLKEALPDCTIYIDSLRENYRTADPFMWVSYHGASACVEMWDEPTFAGRREE